MKHLKNIAFILSYTFLAGMIISFALMVRFQKIDDEGNISYETSLLILNLVFCTLLLLALVFHLIVLAKASKNEKTSSLAQHKSAMESYSPEKRKEKYRTKKIPLSAFYLLSYAQKKREMIYFSVTTIYDLALFLVLYFVIGTLLLTFVFFCLLLFFALLSLYDYAFSPLILRLYTLKAPLPETEIYPDKIIALEGDRLFEVPYSSFDAIVENKSTLLFLYTDGAKKVFFFVKKELKPETVSFLTSKKAELASKKKGS